MDGDSSVIQEVLVRLQMQYGPQHWWPAQSKYEVMVGAILTQNTAWTSVEYAITNLKQAQVLSPEKILALPPRRLGKLIRPAGYYNIKAKRLRALTKWLVGNGGFVKLRALQTGALRKSLLGIHGIGPETADAILLYAFGRPVFVVDAYTRRIFKRVGAIQDEQGYEAIRALFEKKLIASARQYNEYHALIVKHAKEACLKVPRCDVCCCKQLCQQISVS